MAIATASNTSCACQKLKPTRGAGFRIGDKLAGMNVYSSASHPAHSGLGVQATRVFPGNNRIAVYGNAHVIQPSPIYFQQPAAEHSGQFRGTRAGKKAWR